MFIFFRFVSFWKFFSPAFSFCLFSFSSTVLLNTKRIVYFRKNWRKKTVWCRRRDTDVHSWKKCDKNIRIIYIYSLLFFSTSIKSHFLAFLIIIIICFAFVADKLKHECCWESDFSKLSIGIDRGLFKTAFELFITYFFSFVVCCIF